MKLEILIDNNVKEPFITIHTNKVDDNINKLQDKILKLINNKDELLAYLNYETYIIKINDIMSIYSKDKNNYIKVNNKEYIIKETLYSLEEILPDNFIRISNSCIVNVEFIKCFNTSIVGKIIVIMKNGDNLVVSRSRTRIIINYLKERRLKQ